MTTEMSATLSEKDVHRIASPRHAYDQCLRIVADVLHTSKMCKLAFPETDAI